MIDPAPNPQSAEGRDCRVADCPGALRYDGTDVADDVAGDSFRCRACGAGGVIVRDAGTAFVIRRFGPAFTGHTPAMARFHRLRRRANAADTDSEEAIADG